MRKGDKYADIYDSPETIAQAQKDGYHICNDKEKEVRVVFAPNTGRGNESVFAAMPKKAIIDLAKSKNFYDKSFDKLSKEALVSVFIEAAKAKIVEEGKTAEEVAALNENQILELLNDNAVNDELNIVTSTGSGITAQ